VALASRGARDLDTGLEVIDDAAITAQVQKQARGVQLKSILTALVLTAAVTLIF
jgi:hypothetical protein